MRSRMLDKLRSSSGASILMALAVMLVCTMVAAVVLFAASANAGKGSALDARNRAFYSVSSAAQLFADDFKEEAPSAQVSTSSVSYACQEVHPSYVHEDAGVESEQEFIFVARNGAYTPFMQTVDNAVREIDPLDSSSSYERELVVHAPDLDDVVATVRVDYEYNISVDLVSQGDSGYSYAMRVEIPAKFGDPETTTTSEATDVHMDGWEYTEEAQGLSWKETTTLNPSTGNYEPASNEFGSAVAQSYDVVTKTTSRYISWGDPALSKGVAP